MDRFIDFYVLYTKIKGIILKSNMDRFIVLNNVKIISLFALLKSNMDRFIVVNAVSTFRPVIRFKIQYG